MWLLAYCLCLLGGSYDQPTAADPPFLPDMLVRAKAIKVETSRIDQLAAFKIDHVYCGDVKLKGRTFELVTHIPFGMQAGDLTRHLHLPVKQGEVGIWRVRYHGDGKHLIGCIDHGSMNHFDDASPYLGWLGAMPTPGRKVVVDQVPYRTVQQWARTVEEIYHKKDGERIPLLKAATLSENPYIAAWSIYVLGRYKPSGLAKFLEELAANEKLSIAGQVAADEVLSQLLGKQWQTSKNRQRLFDRWASGEIVDTEDALRVIHRLVWAVRQNELDWPTLLAVTTKWLATQNVDYWYSGQLFARSTSPKTERSPETTKLIYDYSIRLIKEAKGTSAKKVGALWLGYLDPLTEEQLSTLKKLQKDAKDPELARLLHHALERHRDPRNK